MNRTAVQLFFRKTIPLGFSSGDSPRKLFRERFARVSATQRSHPSPTTCPRLPMTACMTVKYREKSRHLGLDSPHLNCYTKPAKKRCPVALTPSRNH